MKSSFAAFPSSASPMTRASSCVNAVHVHKAKPSPRTQLALKQSEYGRQKGERPERKSYFRSGPLRLEVKLQSELNIARVAGASNASEVAGANCQGRVAQAAQRIVRAVENIKEVTRSGRSERHSRNSIRAPSAHVDAPICVTNLATERGIRQNRYGWSRLNAGYAAQLPAAQRSADESAPVPEQWRVVEISCGEDVPAVKIRHAVVVPSIAPIVGVCTKSAGGGQRLRPRVADGGHEVALPLRRINLERVVVGRTVA